MLACLLLAGCSAGHPTAARQTELPAAHIDPQSAATLSGRVVFTGAAPPRREIDMSANPACERQHHKAVRSEQVIVNGNGTLRNTFVWVKNGLPHARWDAPAQPVRLDQDGCVYTPHVLGLMVGQPLDIANSDPVNHNVHAEAAVNLSWNESQPPRAEQKRKSFDKEEVWFPVTCGVHPWMRAYIAVVSHPFFAVTGDDGSYSLTGLPPGTYTVEAVHELYGRKETHVTLAPGERKEAGFTYAGS